MILQVKRNAKRNILVGFVNKIVLLILPFVVRATINRVLGTEYLGINSLFTSILTVLNISEMGFSSAVVYHMYKPIVEDDYSTINALLSYFRRVYRIIGIVIILVGLGFIPFLKFFINGEVPTDINITSIYLIQLFDAAISYLLFGYRQSLLVAYQREDINSLVNLIVQVGLKITQIVFIISIKNYIGFVICIPLFTILNNLLILYFSNRLFPHLKCEGTISEKVIESIKYLVYGAFIQKVCDVSRNSLDSICISTFLGLKITAIYGNYFIIFSTINLLLSVIISSITAGIGNHVATNDVDSNFEELKSLDFLYMLVHGWCTVNLLSLVQCLMVVWMGDDMLFKQETIFLLAFYFYVGGIGKVRAMYYSACGLWWEMRYRSICEALVNVVLNIILGYFWGVNGIILATIISLLIVNFIWGNIILFKIYFGMEKLKEYYIYQIKYLLVTVCVCVVIYRMVSMIHANSRLAELFIRTAFSITGTSFLYLGLYYKSNIFKKAISMISKK